MIVVLSPKFLARLAAGVALLLLAASCGPIGDDGDEPTPTPVSANAQPTAPGSGIPLASPPSRPSAPVNTDMSSPADIGSPLASPAASPTASIPATPVLATPSPSPQAAAGDGTTGPVSAPGTPVLMTPTPAAAAEVVVSSCAPESVPPLPGGSATRVVLEPLNFRAGPGTDCDQIGTDPLPAGTVVTVTGGPVVREGEANLEWVQVEVDGAVGWVAAEFLGPVDE